MEEKFQKAISEKLVEYDLEKVSFLQRMGELHQLLNRTQENVTKTIDQVQHVNRITSMSIGAFSFSLFPIVSLAGRRK